MLTVNIVRRKVRTAAQKTAMMTRQSTMMPPATASLFFLNRLQKIPPRGPLLHHCARILGSASIYPISASRFPISVRNAPIVRIAMISGVVPRHHSIEKELSHAGNAEDVLKDDTSADQAREQKGRSA